MFSLVYSLNYKMIQEISLSFTLLRKVDQEKVCERINTMYQYSLQ